MPDNAYYQLYDKRPEYEKLIEQKEKMLKRLTQDNAFDESEISVSIAKR